MRKIALLFLLLGALVMSVTVSKTRPQQEIRKGASVGEESATIFLSPASGQLQIGQTFVINILFNSGGTAISAVATRITYSFGGERPELEVLNISHQSLVEKGDWSCPVSKSFRQEDKILIDISCINTSPAGFTASNETQLVSLEVIAHRLPLNNPLELSFEPSLSAIMRKSDGRNILPTPIEGGVYTING